MAGRHLRAVLAGAVLSAGLGACVSARREVPLTLSVAGAWRQEGLLVTRETPHIELRHAPRTPVRDADLARSEAHLVEVARRLGIEPPARILYLLVSPERMARLGGSPGASESLTRPGMELVPRAAPLRGRYDGIVLSASPRSLHEITHCVSALLIPPEDFPYRTPLVFEGLAMAWQGGGAARALEGRLARLRASGGTHGLRPRDLVGRFPRQDAPAAREAYLVAGSFVGYLVRAYGSRRLAALLRRGRKDRFARVFREIYGGTLEELEARWSAQAAPGSEGPAPEGPAAPEKVPIESGLR